MSVRLKLTIMFLAIALIPLLFVSVLTFNDYKKYLETDRLSDLQIIAAFKADKIETYFSGLKANMAVVQNSDVVKKGLPVLIRFADDPADPEFLGAKKILDGRLRNISSILGLSDIILANPEGKITYVTHPERYTKEFPAVISEVKQKAFKEGKDKTYFSDIFLSKEENNSPAIMVTAPVFDFDSVFIGVIAFEIDITPIYKFIQDVTSLGNTGEVLIGKKIGNQAVFLSPLKYDLGAISERRIAIGKNIGRPIQEAVQGKEGVGQYLDYRGKKVIAAWRYIPSLDWGIVAKIDTQEAFADITKLRNFVIIVLAIIFILCGIIIFSITRSISEPIKRLSKGAEIIGSGNLEYRVGTNLKDEIGQLSRSFDKMAQNLKTITASRDELNKEIIERKQVEEALRQTRDYLENLFNYANAPIVCWDTKFRITRFNHAFERLTNYMAEDILGRDLNVLFPEDSKEESLSKIRRTLTGEYWDVVEIPILRKDGDIRIVLWNSANVYADDGKTLLATIAQGQDITARRKITEALRETNSELEKRVAQRTEELMKARDLLEGKKRLSDIGTLAATVAHELRNPLAAIKMASYNIKRKAQNPALDKHLDNIDTKVSESAQIIDNLLFYSRIKTAQYEKANIYDILAEAISFTIDRFQKYEAVIKKDIDSLKNVIFEADILQMKELFNNILGNSFDALLDHKGKIEIEGRIKNDSIVVNIRDNGCGIDKEDLNKIFDPFFTTKAKGTGLGLSVCYQIARLHSGVINIESIKGKGTAVTIELPIRQKENVKENTDRR